jgi:hypothetical protein
MKYLLGFSLVAAVVAMAIVVGQRMSTDAMAVALGVVFGVAASIPTSLLVVAATRGRRDERARDGRYANPPPAQPKIYIVNPGSQQLPGLGQPGSPYQLSQPGHFAGQPTRRYRVVGEDDAWLDDSAWE